MDNNLILEILDTNAPRTMVEKLHAEARRLTDESFGRDVYARGLIEITNVCRNNCYYCGIRAGNRSVARYTLSQEQILQTCRTAHEAGLRTFVLQGGENPALTAGMIASTVRKISSEFPDSAITLSLGEWDDASLKLFRDAGATRYLLRHETRSERHYGMLHPASMSLDNRIRCLRTLKRLGYQTGTGIMTGSPFQTLRDIISDIEFMRGLQPEMIGIGPFIPAAGTPLASFPPGSVELTLRLISVLRIIFPKANIPATTALATLDPARGRIAGLHAGANVVMPNVSPREARDAYRLYDNKASTGKESIEGLGELARSFAEAGFRLSFDRGDYHE